MDPLTIAALLFGGLSLGSAGIDYLMKSKQLGTEGLGLKLQEKQMEAAAGMGRREEYRADKLMEKMLKFREREGMREDTRMDRATLRDISARRGEQELALLQAIMGINSQMTSLAAQPPQSRSSILSLMR